MQESCQTYAQREHTPTLRVVCNNPKLLLILSHTLLFTTLTEHPHRSPTNTTSISTRDQSLSRKLTMQPEILSRFQSSTYGLAAQLQTSPWECTRNKISKLKMHQDNKIKLTWMVLSQAASPLRLTSA